MNRHSKLGDAAQIAVEAAQAGELAKYLIREGNASLAGLQARTATRFAFAFCMSLGDDIGKEYEAETLRRLAGIAGDGFYAKQFPA